jgi:hypothetical protein
MSRDIRAIIGSEAGANGGSPAKVDSKIYHHSFSNLVGTTNTGGVFHITANTGPVYPDSADTAGVYGTGFKLTDFCTTNFIKNFDYFRVTKIEYVGAIARYPKGTEAQYNVYASVDWDNAQVTDFASLIERPNKVRVVLTGATPVQKLVDFSPRRRISTNADPSLQRVPNPNEWIDCAYADTIIFGNCKFGVLCPDGQDQFPVTAQGRVLVTSRLWVEFKGRIAA